MIAIVLSFDCFPLRMLGCYGNNWIETPNFDLLAAQSAVFDQAYCADLDDAMGNWLRGCYRFPRSPQLREQQPSLLDLLHEQGVSTHLMRESGSEGMSEAPGFGQVTEVEGSSDRDTAPESTPFAGLIQQACRKLDGLDREDSSNRLLWLHGRGLTIPPLPPVGLASFYFDLLEAVEPVPSLDPRRGTILIDAADDLAAEELTEESAEEREPDQDERPQRTDEEIAAILDRLEQSSGDLSSWSRQDWRVLQLVAAGMAGLIDAWLGKLLKSLAAVSANQEVLVIVTAARGGELGEQAQLPADAARDNGSTATLRDATVHVPLMVHHSATGVGSRHQQLVQSIDVPPTLADWFDVDSGPDWFEGLRLGGVTSEQETGCRDFAVVGDRAGNRYVRTSDLSLQIPVTTADTGAADVNGLTAEALSHDGRLFAKPDDRWDLLDLAPQSPRDVVSLAQRLLIFEQTAAGTAVVIP